MHDPMKLIANNLFWLRKKHKYSQEFVARTIKRSVSVYLLLEKSRVKYPNLFNLNALAKLYEVPLDDLVNKDLTNEKELFEDPIDPKDIPWEKYEKQKTKIFDRINLNKDLTKRAYEFKAGCGDVHEINLKKTI